MADPRKDKGNYIENGTFKFRGKRYDFPLDSLWPAVDEMNWGYEELIDPHRCVAAVGLIFSAAEKLGWLIVPPDEKIPQPNTKNTAGHIESTAPASEEE